MTRMGNRRRSAAWVGVAIASVFVLSVASVELAPPGADVAAWWPAAGIAVLLAARSTGRKLLVILGLIMIAVVAANMVAGREFIVALGFGLANTLESWVGATLLRDRNGRLFGLDSILGLVRILVTAIVCGLTAAMIAGVTIAVLADGEFLRTVGSVLPAHAAAVLLITPLGLRVMDGGRRAGAVETLAQWILLLAALGVVFGVNQNLPVAFVPYAFLVWGATRLSVRAFQLQLITTGICVAALSSFGFGPFGIGRFDGPESASLVQVYLLTSGLVFYSLAVLVGLQRQFATALGSSEELFRESFSNALVGMVIAVRDGRGLRVDLANPVATAILELPDGPGGDPRTVFTLKAQAALDVATPLDRRNDAAGWRGQLETETGKVIDAYVAPLTSAGFERRFAIQFADVSEKAMAERALLRAIEYERKAGARLRSLDGMKNSLISSVSHELRTPLAGILGYSEMLLDGDGGQLTIEQAEMIAIVERSGQRLSRIVEDLLTMSRIETSKSRADTEWLDPVADARSVCAELRPLADAKNHHLVLSASESDRLGLRAVPDDLHMIIMNLVANAIKYTPEGGTIEVTTRIVDGSLHLDVIDDGVGIAAEDHQKVFTQFYRTNTGDDAASGTGLGLAIVDALVRRNRGVIAVDSAVGRGTRMTVSFALEEKPHTSEPAGASHVQAPAGLSG